jgi:DNA-binding transcriptional ArsR family regulator
MEIKQTVQRLAALAQENRLAVFRLLVQAGAPGMAAGRIAEGLNLAPATLSFHLKELANAGLVQARQEGRFIYYSADFAAMNDLIATLTENCCGGEPCLPACGAACNDKQKCA